MVDVSVEISPHYELRIFHRWMGLCHSDMVRRLGSFHGLDATSGMKKDQPCDATSGMKKDQPCDASSSMKKD